MNLDGKIIDGHTHLGIFIQSLFDDKYPSSGDPINLLEKMNAHKVDYSIVFPFPDQFTGKDDTLYDKVMMLLGPVPYRLANERLLLEINQLKINRFLPFLMFSINYGISEQIEYLESKANENTIFGLKYYPDSDMVNVKNLLKEGKPFIEFLLRHNMPLVIHCSEAASTNNNGYSNPLDMLCIAEEYPDLRMCIAHMGQFNEKLIDYIIENDMKNVYLDTSPFLHLCYVRSINGIKNCLNFDYTDPITVMKGMYVLLPDNIIWGSDCPFNYTCNLNNDNHNKKFEYFLYSEYYALLDKLPKEMRLKIASENTIRYLFG